MSTPAPFDERPESSAGAAAARDPDKVRVGWPLIVVILLVAAVAGCVIFYLKRQVATPWAEPADAEVFQDLEPVPGGVKSNDYQVFVKMGQVDGGNESRPAVTYIPPAEGNRGVPRLSIEQDAATKGWKMVFVPPTAKTKELREAVSEVKSGWVQQDGEGEKKVGSSDEKNGSRLELPLPSGSVTVKEEKALAATDFAAEKQKAMDETVANFRDFLKAGDGPRRDLVRRIEALGKWAIAEWLNRLPDDPNAALEELANKQGILLTLKKVDTKDTPKPYTIPPFWFIADGLNWIGSIPYSSRNARSVLVKVEVTHVPAKYELVIRGEVMSKNALAGFQLGTGAWFADEDAKRTSGLTSGHEWLLSSNVPSLRPLFLIPVLQSCRHYVHEDSTQMDDRGKNARIARDMLKNINDATLGQIENRLDGIKADTSHSYHNLYLYCEYVVALVHLQKLAKAAKGEWARDLKWDKLDKVIKKGATTIAGQVRDGHVWYFDNSGWDRSVGQVGLYAIQYVLFEYAGDPDVDPIRDKLKVLVRHMAQTKGDVRYKDDHGPSGALKPAYYQGLIAQAQVGEITPAAFQAELVKLDEYFKSYDASVAGYSAAYRWMYWARVYELLYWMRNDPTLRTYIGNRSDPTPNLAKALEALTAQVRQAFPGKGYAEPVDITLAADAGNDYAAGRRAMLAIALESIWEAQILPDGPK